MAGSQSVSVTRGPWYEYSDYNLGSYRTAPYYVNWGGISATAYCVQPSKPGPDDGTYTITKLADNKELAKVCYYGAKASEENGFFAEKHPDFSAGNGLSLRTWRQPTPMVPATGIPEPMPRDVPLPWNFIITASVCRIFQMWK